MSVPLSILDLAPISAGSDAASALRNTVDLAQNAERWGYRRYWVAEHHFVALASSSPAVLIGQIAAATSRIHVGAAAVQLGHTTAVAVLESFGMLDAFHPGRIDLGIGRAGQKRAEIEKAQTTAQVLVTSPPEWREVDGVVIPPPFDLARVLGTSRMSATMSTLQQPEAVTPDFGAQVRDILAMVDGTYEVGGFDVHVVPGERSDLTPWVFGSSKGASAQVAARHGLPFVASYHISPGTALDAVAEYRDRFRPSAMLQEPYVGISADVLAADDAQTARRLASSYGQWLYSIRARDGAAPYPDPETAEPLSDEQFAVVKDRLATQFVGTADEVADRLDALQRLSGADEVVISSIAHRHEDRLRSHELIAKRWGTDS